MEEKNKLKKIGLPKNEIPTKLLFVQKLKELKSKRNLINSKIKEFFDSPEKYFTQNYPRILVNKNIIIKKITPLAKLNQSIKANSSEYREKYLSNSNYNKSQNKEKSLMTNFESINNEKLKDIFNSYRNQRKVIKKKYLSKSNINSFEKNIPEQLSLDLDYQYRKLNQKELAEKKSRKISKYISRKIHIKENNLLLNNIKPYCYKKQIIDNEITKNDIHADNQSWMYKWVSSLRRPKNFIGRSTSFINLSNDNNNPLWSIRVENFPFSEEQSFISRNNLDKKKLNSIEIDRIKNYEKINIKGEKLYELEYKREMSSNSRKILHKSFVDNGRLIMYKDVNSIFGDKTLYKNYLGRNKKNKNNSNINSRYHSMNDIKIHNLDF